MSLMQALRARLASDEVRAFQQSVAVGDTVEVVRGDMVGFGRIVYIDKATSQIEVRTA